MFCVRITFRREREKNIIFNVKSYNIFEHLVLRSFDIKTQLNQELKEEEEDLKIHCAIFLYYAF
jgi:hypothetical protein